MGKGVKDATGAGGSGTAALLDLAIKRAREDGAGGGDRNGGGGASPPKHRRLDGTPFFMTEHGPDKPVWASRDATHRCLFCGSKECSQKDACGKSPGSSVKNCFTPLPQVTPGVTRELLVAAYKRMHPRQ